MSRDRDKLITILNELEKDYHSGNISKERYADLHGRYMYKLKTIDASNRIRSMQGRENYSSSSRGKSNRNSGHNQNRQDSRNNYSKNRNSRNPNSSNYNYNKNHGARKPRGPYNNQTQRYDSRPPRGGGQYNRNNPRNYAPNNSQYRDKNAQDEPKKSGTIAVGILFTVVLLFAFGAGIAMGIFNMDNGLVDNGISDLIGSGASINDTAFPIVKKNVTTSFNYTSSNYTSNTSSYDDSGSDSGGSYDSGSDSGGGYDSGSDSDGGYDSGSDSGSDSGGSSD